MRYVALLRGINVGGKNAVKMATLRQAFEDHGFTRVSTYINSGNILFDTEESDTQRLRTTCEQIIQNTFGLDISVMVFSAEEYIETIAKAPDWWRQDKESTHNAVHVMAPATPEIVLEAVGKTNPDVEKLAHAGQIIFWSAPLKTYSRTKLHKIMGTTAYHSVTVRNGNTATKLAALLEQPPK